MREKIQCEVDFSKLIPFMERHPNKKPYTKITKRKQKGHKERHNPDNRDLSQVQTSMSLSTYKIITSYENTVIH